MGSAGSAISAVSTVVRRRSFPYVAPTVPAGVEPLPEKGRAGLDYETEWARQKPARLVLVPYDGEPSLLSPRTAEGRRAASEIVAAGHAVPSSTRSGSLRRFFRVM